MSHIQSVKLIPAPRFRVYEYMTAPDKISEQLSGLVEVQWQNPGVAVDTGSEFLFVMARYGVEQPIRFVVDRLVTGHSLSYRQMSGLFSRFTHTMKFEDHGQDETLVTDLVEYSLPFGLVGRLADDFYVRRDMEYILEYRLNKVQTHFNN